MRFCFVVKSLEISGGIYVVLQHALFLSHSGVDVTVATTGTFDDVAGWHPGLPKLRICPLDGVASERFDLAIATWWPTAYDLHRVDAAKYLYFVQGADYLAQPTHLREPAERTFNLGLDAITVSAKLGEALTEDYGMTALVAPNGIDRSVFSDSGPAMSPRKEGRLRVLVEGPLGSKTKGVAFAIRLARQARVDEIWLLTSSRISWYPGVDRTFSRLSAPECASVYRSCDILLKLSTLESCCLPNLEMLHCGGIVIAYAIPGPDEYLVDGYNALLLPVGDECGVIDGLRALKGDPALMIALRSGARKTADDWPAWNQSSRTFYQHCLKLMEEPGPSREDLKFQTLLVSSSVQETASSRLQSRAKFTIKRLGRLGRLEEIKILLRALLVEQRMKPPSVMYPRVASK